MAETPPRHAGGGWVEPNRLPRGPNGRARCRWCGTEVPERRRTFCGQACVNQHLCRASAAGAARVLRRRDHGICALCGRDCEALAVELRDLFYESGREAVVRRCVELGLRYERRKRPWDVDHIRPVVRGGGSCGPENLRTLCWACHRSETAKLAAERAQERRPQLSLGLEDEDG